MLLFDVEKGKLLHPRTGHPMPVLELSFTKSGRLVSGCEMARCEWDMTSGQLRDRRFRMTTPLPRGEKVCSVFSSEGLIATIEGKQAWRLRDWAAGRVVRHYAAKGQRMTHASLSPDSRRLLVHDDWNQFDDEKERPGKSRVVDLASGKVLWSFQKPLGTTLDWSASGREVVHYRDDEVRVLDGSTGKVIASLRQDGKSGTIVKGTKGAIPREDEWIVVRDGRLWHLPTGKVLPLVLPADEQGALEAYAFSPDNRAVALTNQFAGTIHVHDTATGRRRGTFSAHAGGVAQVAFSLDGKVLASGGEDGTILLWDMARLQPARRAPVFPPRPPR